MHMDLIDLTAGRRTLLERIAGKRKTLVLTRTWPIRVIEIDILAIISVASLCTVIIDLVPAF